MKTYDITENSDGSLELTTNKSENKPWILALLFVPVIIFYLFKTNFYPPLVIISIICVAISIAISFWVYSSAPVAIAIHSNEVTLTYPRLFGSNKLNSVLRANITGTKLSVTRWGNKRQGYIFNGCVDIVNTEGKKVTIYSVEQMSEEGVICDIKNISSMASQILKVPNDETVEIKK